MTQKLPNNSRTANNRQHLSCHQCNNFVKAHGAQHNLLFESGRLCIQISWRQLIVVPYKTSYLVVCSLRDHWTQLGNQACECSKFTCFHFIGSERVRAMVKAKNACNDVEPDANKFYCFSCPSTIHRMHVIQTICIVHTKPSLVKPYRRMRTHLLIIRICCSSFVEFVFPLPSEWHMEKIRGHSWSIDVAGKLSLHTNDNWLRALTWFMLPELLRSCFGVLFHLIYVIRLR